MMTANSALVLLHLQLLPGTLAMRAEGTQLMASTQVATLDADGAIAIPAAVRANITGLLVEIGCSDFYTMDEVSLDYQQHRNDYLLSFEPMLDKYAVLLARGTVRQHNRSIDRGVALGQFHPRGTVLPFAVSLEGGPQTFTVSKQAGCSSLLNISSWFADALQRYSWAPFCHEVLEKRTVDTISALQLAALLPRRLPIRVLKIDAQGLDLKLMMAMPDEVWERTQAVQLEARLRRCKPLYEGQESCEEMVEAMVRRGFKPRAECRPGCPHCGSKTTCEQNVLFVRPGWKHIDLPAWNKNGDVGR